MIHGFKKKGTFECKCGASFRSMHKLARHVHKWNGRADLRERPLTRP